MTKIEDRPWQDNNEKLRRRGVTDSEMVADSNSKDALDRRLDEALNDTFPASDPVSIVISLGK